MISRLSHTRITLALDIIQKHTDGPLKGYHELNTVKHQIELADTIQVESSKERNIVCQNPLVPCDSKNICWKVVDLFKEKFKISSDVNITIEKRIPVMGGMAGGSANAATVMLMLNDLWGLGLDKFSMCNLARELGMDIPFFFYGYSAQDSETTGSLQQVETDIKATFVIAIPEFGVSTKDAYGQLDYSVIAKDLEKTERVKDALIKNDIVALGKNMHNDFEISVFKSYPKLYDIKTKLAQMGCLGVTMSGSGSTIVGLVENIEKAKEIQKKCDFKIIITSSLTKN